MPLSRSEFICYRDGQWQPSVTSPESAVVQTVDPCFSNRQRLVGRNVLATLVTCMGQARKWLSVVVDKTPSAAFEQRARKGPGKGIAIVGKFISEDRSTDPILYSFPCWGIETIDQIGNIDRFEP